MRIVLSRIRKTESKRLQLVVFLCLIFLPKYKTKNVLQKKNFERYSSSHAFIFFEIYPTVRSNKVICENVKLHFHSIETSC